MRLKGMALKLSERKGGKGDRRNKTVETAECTVALKPGLLCD